VSIIEELRTAYPTLDVPTKVEEWKKSHPGEDPEKGLRKLLNKRNAPESTFALRICHTCNHDCIHCFNEEEKKENANQKVLTTEELFGFLDKDTSDLVLITGGEPTTRKDLLEILKHISENGRECTLQSNGFRFADTEYTNSLAPYFQGITLPIHSSDPDIFDAITKCKGSFENTIKALKNLRDTEKITIITQTVINQLNYKTIESTFDLIQSIHPGVSMTLTFPHPISSAYSTAVTPRFTDIKPYVQKAIKKYGYLIHTHYLPRCVLHPYQTLVDILDRNDVAEVPKPGIEFIEGKWDTVNYETTSEYRIKSPVCLQCRFNTECNGIWREYGELYPDLDLLAIKGV